MPDARGTGVFEMVAAYSVCYHSFAFTCYTEYVVLNIQYWCRIGGRSGVKCATICLRKSLEYPNRRRALCATLTCLRHRALSFCFFLSRPRLTIPLVHLDNSIATEWKPTQPLRPRPQTATSPSLHDLQRWRTTKRALVNAPIVPSLLLIVALAASKAGKTVKRNARSLTAAKNANARTGLLATSSSVKSPWSVVSSSESAR
jgi:hypothetical protein